MKLDTQLVHKIICANSSLASIYRWYLSHCLSLNVPYHNLRHTLGMIHHVIMVYNKSREVGSEYGFTLNDSDLYVLLISALFHDYNHSAGRFDDSVNISNAITGLRECMSECLVKDDVYETILEQCEENIRATQYPYTVYDIDLTVHQRILRESDILVVLYDDCITQNIMGLAAEMHQTDMEAFLVKYLQFILDAVKDFKLAYSLETWNAESERFLKEIDAFAKIFTK